MRGPASVVEAMADGKAAAESISRFLRGEDVAFGRAYAGPYLTEFEVNLADAAPQGRVVLGKNRYLQAGQGSFEELECGMTEEEAVQEAGRCVNCGLPVGYHRTCWFCLPCEVECPEEALWVEIPYLLR